MCVCVCVSNGDEQVETLGDNVYMVAGGVPDRQVDHAESIAAVALEFRTKVKQIRVPDNTDELRIRIGIYFGLSSSVAAIVVFRDPAAEAPRFHAHQLRCKQHWAPGPTQPPPPPCGLSSEDLVRMTGTMECPLAALRIVVVIIIIIKTLWRPSTGAQGRLTTQFKKNIKYIKQCEKYVVIISINTDPILSAVAAVTSSIVRRCCWLQVV